MAAIFPNKPGPIGVSNRFATRSVGSVRKAGAVATPHTQFNHSMLAQASRVPRLANITSVSAALRAHAGAASGKKK
jgi:hypothetical protein